MEISAIRSERFIININGEGKTIFNDVAQLICIENPDGSTIVRLREDQEYIEGMYSLIEKDGSFFSYAGNMVFYDIVRTKDGTTGVVLQDGEWYKHVNDGDWIIFDKEKKIINGEKMLKNIKNVHSRNNDKFRGKMFEMWELLKPKNMVVNEDLLTCK